MEDTATVVGALSAGLPILLLQFVIALAMLGIGVLVYVWITPYDDLALIRQGNAAAGLMIAGVTVGLALPLYAILGHHVGTPDVLLWGTIAVLLQIAVIVVAIRAVRGLGALIEANNVAVAIALSAVQIAIALINAGLMSAD
jgi:putative membrane protein